MKNLKLRAWLKEDKEMISVEGMAFDTKYVRGFYKLDSRWFKLEQVELMQSTGLLDKNGKEIFEGDIIRYNIDVVDIKRHPTLGFYTVLDGREGFFGDGMSIDDFEEDAKEFSKTAEIIGNIYENPELLGQ